MNLCSLTMKKYLHNLMNRCIRDPYVQWCESLSLLAFASRVGYSIASRRVFSSLHSKPCLSSLVNVTPLFISQSCGGAFFTDNFLHLHYTEHTLWLALDAGRTCGLPKCVRFGCVISQGLTTLIVSYKKHPSQLSMIGILSIF